MAPGFRELVLLLIVLAGHIGAATARADSWAAPRQTPYHSENGLVRLIVTPHFPPGDRAPYVGEARGPSSPDRARAVLQRRDARGRWVEQWRGPLLNEVAPVDAVVANSGRYFVTFDDWGGQGTGPNVVVIYDGAGRPLRALSLLDLVPQEYVDALLHTFSSIWWTDGGHRISADEERLLVRVGLPTTPEPFFPGGHFELAVSLASGAPVRSGQEWDRAMAAATDARVAARERQAERLAFMTQPLAPPPSADREAWDDYLREAFKRLAPDWERNNPWNMLVRPPGTPPYVGAFSPDPRTIFSERDLPLAIAIASPEGVPLGPALAPLVEGRRPGWLRGTRLYVVADDAAWPNLVSLFTPSGATLIQLDPDEPIPQRPERLSGR